MDTVSDATEALRRHRFASLVSTELAQLAEDEETRSDYLGEAESTAVIDGIVTRSS